MCHRCGSMRPERSCAPATYTSCPQHIFRACDKSLKKRMPYFVSHLILPDGEQTWTGNAVSHAAAAQGYRQKETRGFSAGNISISNDASPFFCFFHITFSHSFHHISSVFQQNLSFFTFFVPTKVKTCNPLFHTGFRCFSQFLPKNFLPISFHVPGTCMIKGFARQKFFREIFEICLTFWHKVVYCP